jgi:molecular chaperone GrpE
VTDRKNRGINNNSENSEDITNGVFDGETLVPDEDTDGNRIWDTSEGKEEIVEDKETLSDSTEELSRRLEKAENEKHEISDRLLRTMAEFDNYKKRVSKEKEELIKYGTEKLAFDLLPVVDNFERALEQAKGADDVASVIEGIEMILNQLIKTLETFHVKSFDSIGKSFDPEKHEAIAQQEHEGYENNTVIDEFHKGYSLRDKLLRPAKVIVSVEPSEKERTED